MDFVWGALAGLVLGPLLILIFLRLALRLLRGSKGQAAAEVGGGLVGPPLPTDPPARTDYSWPYKKADGSDTTLEAHKGRVILLNVWATWCGPCVMEMPSLQKLHEIVGDEVDIVCLSKEEPHVVADFIKEKGYTFPVGTYDCTPPSPFLSDAVPATFIVLKDGRVILRHLGAADWSSPKVVQLLRRAAASDMPDLHEWVSVKKKVDL